MTPRPPARRFDTAYRAPFGWRRGADAWEPDDEEQATVARALELHAGGLGVNRITRALAEEGYRGRDGRPLSKGFVGHLLHDHAPARPLVRAIVAPFGYAHVAGALVPHLGEQATLLRMVTLREAGVVLTEIAEILNEEGRVPRFGGRWHASTVLIVLRAEGKRRGEALPGGRLNRRAKVAKGAAPPTGEYAAERAHLERHRPRVRGDCRGKGWCPYVGCKYHLGLEVNARTGSVLIRQPDPEDPGAVDVDAGACCALDVAERGGVTLEAVADALGVVRERVRQIEEDALRKLRKLNPRVLDALRLHLAPEHGPGEGER